MKEQLQNAAKLILLVLILVIAVMITECERSKAACKAVELMPGYHTPVIIRGELSLAYTELVNRQIIGEKEAKVEKKAKHMAVEELANGIYHENWNTDKDHVAAYYTGAVVMNRVKSPNFPDNVHDVLYQKGQYSTTHKFFTKEIPEECYQMARDIIENGTPDVPENVVYQSMRAQGSGVWKVINGEYFCYE